MPQPVRGTTHLAPNVLDHRPICVGRQQPEAVLESRLPVGGGGVFVRVLDGLQALRQAGVQIEARRRVVHIFLDATIVDGPAEVGNRILTADVRSG